MQDLTSEKSSVLLKNIRSASKNLEELRVVLKEEKNPGKIVAIVLTETWLKDNSPANVYKLDGFNSPIMCNQARRGGGVSVSVKDGLKFRVVKNCRRPFANINFANSNEPKRFSQYHSSL